MKNQKKQAVAWILTAVILLFGAAFAPQSPRAAWWCTAFSITCGEAASERTAVSEQVEFRSFLADLLLHKDNT